MISLTDETGRLDEDQLTLLGEHLGAYLMTGAGDGLPELPEGMPRFSVVLVDDLQMAALNARDRGIPGPTDVLSYPANEPDDSGFPLLPFLGDIIISLDTAARQADEEGHDLLSEVLLLAVHGFTHLLGHDHQTEDDWDVFRKEQDKMLELLRNAGGEAA